VDQFGWTERSMQQCRTVTSSSDIAMFFRQRKLTTSTRVMRISTSRREWLTAKSTAKQLNHAV
jgi:hypothetical protein